MNRFAIPLAAFVLLVVVFMVSLHRTPDRQFVKSALIGKPAPEFTLPDLLNPGATVSNSQFKGKWYLLNVWGTWCVECRGEHQTLLDIQRSGKVFLAGLNYKDEDDAAREWLTQLGNPWAVIAVDKEGRAAIDWGVYGAPETFLVNPQGTIVDKIVGQVTPDIWQTRLLPKIEGTAK